MSLLSRAFAVFICFSVSLPFCLSTIIPSFLFSPGPSRSFRTLFDFNLFCAKLCACSHICYYLCQIFVILSLFKLVKRSLRRFIQGLFFVVQPHCRRTGFCSVASTDHMFQFLPLFLLSALAFPLTSSAIDLFQTHQSIISLSLLSISFQRDVYVWLGNARGNAFSLCWSRSWYGFTHASDFVLPRFLFDCVCPLDTLFPCSLAKQCSHRPRDLLIFIMIPLTCEKKYRSKYW